MSFSPAAERNREPILEVLKTVFPQGVPLRVLEIGSGTGQHAVFFAAKLPELEWWTSDLVRNHDGIRERLQSAGLDNVHGPLTLDVGRFPDVGAVDVVYTSNTAHIMSAAEVRQMFGGVSELLRPGGLFVLYGPVNRDGRFTSESNRGFHESLQRENPLMGLRDDKELDKWAAEHGLERKAGFDLPANNRVLVWRRPAL